MLSIHFLANYLFYYFFLLGSKGYVPDIRVKFKDTYALLGQNVTLECFALGKYVCLNLVIYMAKCGLFRQEMISFILLSEVIPKHEFERVLSAPYHSFFALKSALYINLTCFSFMHMAPNVVWLSITATKKHRKWQWNCP